MFDILQNQIHQSVDELFASAAVDELAGDGEAHLNKLKDISIIADVLGIKTEITSTTFSLKEILGDNE